MPLITLNIALEDPRRLKIGGTLSAGKGKGRLLLGVMVEAKILDQTKTRPSYSNHVEQVK